MENKNTIELNVVHLDGGLRKKVENNNATELDFLYLPDIGITTDIISALNTTIQVTAEQVQAILDVEYIKFAPTTGYNPMEHYNIVVQESPIFAVKKKKEWVAHDIYRYSVTFMDINASPYEVDATKASEYIINGNLVKGYIYSVSDTNADYIFNEIDLQFKGFQIVAPPTAEEMQNIKNDIAGLLSYNKSITIPENQTVVYLPNTDETYAGFNEGFYKIVVPETDQVIKIQAYGEKATVEATLNSGINYVQYRNLYSLADAWGTTAHKCEIFDASGSYQKGIAEGVSIRGGVQYQLLSDSAIPTDIQVTFFGGKKDSNTGGGGL